MPSLACLCRLQVAVKGQALLAVQTGCCSGLSQPSRAYCPLKEAHHNLPFRDAGTTTCTYEKYGSVGFCSGLSQPGRTYCPLKEAHHYLPFRHAGTTTCTDERGVSIGGICNNYLSQSGAYCCSVTEKHHDVPLQDACTAACTDERDVSRQKCSSRLSWYGSSLYH